MHESLDALAVLATVTVKSRTFEIRQLVTGALASRELGSRDFTAWPVGFRVEDICDAIVRESLTTPGERPRSDPPIFRGN